MLNLPIGTDMLAVQTRVRKVIFAARADDDCLLLQQLWCLLRNAEMAMAQGPNKALLHQMRDRVVQEMSALGDIRPV